VDVHKGREGGPAHVDARGQGAPEGGSKPWFFCGRHKWRPDK